MKTFKDIIFDYLNKKKDEVIEDAPANAVGNGAAVALPPTHEPGVDKKKKKNPVMANMSRKIKESDDNNSVLVKSILDNIDKIEKTIDEKSYGKQENIGAVGGVRLGNYDNAQPMVSLGKTDTTPKKNRSKDSRGVGLHASYSSQAPGTMRPYQSMKNIMAKRQKEK
jgi:hypothetical protein